MQSGNEGRCRVERIDVIPARSRLCPGTPDQWFSLGLASVQWVATVMMRASALTPMGPTCPVRTINMAKHQNKHIREAIKYAEEHGWTFVKAGPRAHVYGVLYCPRHDRDGHRFNVHSTPRNPETHAAIFAGR